MHASSQGLPRPNASPMDAFTALWHYNQVRAALTFNCSTCLFYKPSTPDVSPFSLSLLRLKALTLSFARYKSGAVVDNWFTKCMQRQQANDEGVRDPLLGEGDPYGLHTPQPESSGTARTAAASMPGDCKLEGSVYMSNSHNTLATLLCNAVLLAVQCNSYFMLCGPLPFQKLGTHDA